MTVENYLKEFVRGLLLWSEEIRNEIHNYSFKYFQLGLDEEINVLTKMKADSMIQDFLYLKKIERAI